MKKYYKEENGFKIWFDGILVINDKQIINPTEEMILSNGWTKYKEPILPEITKEELLTIARNNKLNNLVSFDNSHHVNNCIILKDGNSLYYWADKIERDALKGAVKDLLNAGRTQYRLDLREFRVSVDIDCDKLLQMLGALEVYAVDCYNVTTDHIYAIQSLTTIEEIEAYDYTVGYPEKLTFEL